MCFSPFILWVYCTPWFITFFSFSATALRMRESWQARAIKFVDKECGIEQNHVPGYSMSQCYAMNYQHIKLFYYTLKKNYIYIKLRQFLPAAYFIFLVIHVPNEAWIIGMTREWRASFKIFQDLIFFSLMTIRLRSSITGVYNSINWYKLPKQKNVDKNKTYTSYS